MPLVNNKIRVSGDREARVFTHFIRAARPPVRLDRHPDVIQTAAHV